MMPTRLSTLLSLFVGTAAIAWGALGAAETQGRVLPPLPVGAPGAILGLAVAVLITGVALRRRLRGKPGSKPPHPIGVARLAVLGKTSSHVGAILGGGYGGYALLLLRSLEIAARRERAVIAAVAVVAAGFLVAAGLFLEQSCRVPPQDEKEATADGT
jgi:hypothetical protein